LASAGEALHAAAHLIEDLVGADFCQIAPRPLGETSQDIDLFIECDRNVFLNHLDMNDGAIAGYEFRLFGRKISLKSEASDGLGMNELRSTIYIDKNLRFEVYVKKLDRPFSVRDVNLFALLLPHVERSTHAVVNLANATAHCLAASVGLDRLSVAFFVVTWAGRMVLANESAQKYIDLQKALMLRDGYVCGRGAANEEKFKKRLVEMALMRADSDLFSLDNNGEAPTFIRMMHLADISEIGPLSEGGIAIFINTPGRQAAPQTRALTSLYGLTEAEARVTKAIINGLSIGQYAALHNISINTAKTQLRESFAKIGVNRQVELVREVIGNPLLALWW
jgi:DNA-binding CsgD family transcriptional regulator